MRDFSKFARFQVLSSRYQIWHTDISWYSIWEIWSRKGKMKRNGSEARKVVNHCSLGYSFMRSDKKSSLQIGCVLSAVGFCRNLATGSFGAFHTRDTGGGIFLLITSHLRCSIGQCSAFGSYISHHSDLHIWQNNYFI